MSLFSVYNVKVNKIKYPSIDIEENEVTFICGKSGSGKSTLLKLLNASISPKSGEIRYRNKPILEYDTILLRREIMLVSQSVFLFDDTIENNFKEFYRYRAETPPDDQTILKYLRLCLADFPLSNNCREMSVGERQRIFIAICLSFTPSVLMLDEPTSALDEYTSKTLMQNLTDYCKKSGIPLLVITHDKVLAEQFADKVLVLKDLEE